MDIRVLKSGGKKEKPSGKHHKSLKIIPKRFKCLFASQRSRVRSPSSPPKMEIAVVKTTAISRLTTEIPQIGFDFDHLKGTPFRKEYPSFVCVSTG